MESGQSVRRSQRHREWGRSQPALARVDWISERPRQWTLLMESQSALDGALGCWDLGRSTPSVPQGVMGSHRSPDTSPYRGPRRLQRKIDIRMAAGIFHSSLDPRRKTRGNGKTILVVSCFSWLFINGRLLGAGSNNDYSLSSDGDEIIFGAALSLNEHLPFRLSSPFRLHRRL